MPSKRTFRELVSSYLPIRNVIILRFEKQKPINLTTYLANILDWCWTDCLNKVKQTYYFGQTLELYYEWLDLLRMTESAIYSWFYIMNVFTNLVWGMWLTSCDIHWLQLSKKKRKSEKVLPLNCHSCISLFPIYFSNFQMFKLRYKPK